MFMWTLAFEFLSWKMCEEFLDGLSESQLKTSEGKHHIVRRVNCA